MYDQRTTLHPSQQIGIESELSLHPHDVKERRCDSSLSNPGAARSILMLYSWRTTSSQVKFIIIQMNMRPGKYTTVPNSHYGPRNDSKKQMRL